MNQPDATPLHVVTGFLGAGKTSLINRLLRAPELADSLVVVNEFGEIGLDHLLFETVADDVILLASGCLCCQLRGDLVDALHGVLRRRDAGEIAPFARVILETSGLADLAPILHALFADPALARRTRLGGVTTLVDAVNGEATLAAHGEARRQVALADRLALTKTDLVADRDGLARLRAAVAEINPAAPVSDVAAGEFHAREFLDETLAFAARRATTQMSAHGATVSAWTFSAEALVEDQALAHFQALLGASLGPRLLRVKGVVATRRLPDRPLLIQGAQHVLHPPRRLGAWPDGARLTRMIVIADGIDGGEIERLWRALIGAPELDRPDLAAIADNPLAPRRAGLLG